MRDRGFPASQPAPSPTAWNPLAPGNLVLLLMAWNGFGSPGGRAEVKLLTWFQSKPAIKGLKVISLLNKQLLWGVFSAFMHPDESIFLCYLETLQGRRNGIIFFLSVVELTCNFPSSSCSCRFPWKPLISVSEVKASSGVCAASRLWGWTCPRRSHQCCRSSRDEAGLGNLGNDLIRITA